VAIVVDSGKCSGCGVCEEICPEDVLRMVDGVPYAARPNECWYCGACMMDCAKGAIKVVFPRHLRPVVLPVIKSGTE